MNSQKHSANTSQHPYMLQPSQLYFPTLARLNTSKAVTLHNAPVTRSDSVFKNTVSTPQPESSPRSNLCSPQSYNSSIPSNDESIIDVFTQF